MALAIGRGRVTTRERVRRSSYVEYRSSRRLPMAGAPAGATAQLVARRWGGRATFEDMLSALGFAIALASWCTLAHDLVTSGLGAFAVIDQRGVRGRDELSDALPTAHLDAEGRVRCG